MYYYTVDRYREDNTSPRFPHLITWESECELNPGDLITVYNIWYIIDTVKYIPGLHLMYLHITGLDIHPISARYYLGKRINYIYDPNKKRVLRLTNSKYSLLTDEDIKIANEHYRKFKNIEIVLPERTDYVYSVSITLNGKTENLSEVHSIYDISPGSDIYYGNNIFGTVINKVVSTKDYPFTHLGVSAKICKKNYPLSLDDMTYFISTRISPQTGIQEILINKDILRDVI